MAEWTVVCDDVVKWAETYAEEPAHAIICDPPYGLGETPNIHDVLDHWMKGDTYNGSGRGFVSAPWDSFVPGPHIWAALRKHCYPGAYLFAFGGTRTADLLSIAIRMGGWERFDQIDWIYGAGFPKSHAVGLAIDRAAGVEREVIGYYGVSRDYTRNGKTGDMAISDEPVHQTTLAVTAPTTPLARLWSGYGTALKPAHEPILIFRNPRRGTFAENCSRTGAGALNIDGGRIGVGSDKIDGGCAGKTRLHEGGITDRMPVDKSKGRWPSNCVLGHLPSCQRVGMKKVRGITGGATSGTNALGQDSGWNKHTNVETEISRYTDEEGFEEVDEWQCSENCPVASLNSQAGNHKSGLMVAGQQRKGTLGGGGYHGDFPDTATEHDTYGDSGNVSRFFFQADWSYEIAERLDEASPVYSIQQCLLCSRKHDIMNETQEGDIPCENVNGAELISGLKDLNSDSVAVDAVQPGPQEGVDKSGAYYTCAESAEKSSSIMQGTIASIAPENVLITLDDQLLQIVKSAATLCDSCAIVTARSIALTLQGHDPESLRFPDYITGRSKLILNRSLALSAASLGRTDITQIMQSRKILSGFARSVIANYMANVDRAQPVSVFHNALETGGRNALPVLYQSKAGRAERDAGLNNRCEHPTVKPISLTKYLATLLLPPAAYAPRRILVPFAGVMSEAIGAALAGWDEITAIEMDESYCEIGEARMRFWNGWKARGLDDPKAILKAANKPSTRSNDQLHLDLSTPSPPDPSPASPCTDTEQ